MDIALVWCGPFISLPSNPCAPPGLCPEEVAIRAPSVSLDLSVTLFLNCVYLFISFLVALGLCCCGRGLSLVVQSGGYTAAHGLLIAVASLVSEHRL